MTLRTPEKLKTIFFTNKKFLFFALLAVFKAYHIPDLQDLQDIIMSDDYFDSTTLLAKLNSLHRRVQHVDGDGNCLFRAVSDQLVNHPTHPVNIDHVALRRATVLYMKNNKKELKV